LPLRSRPTPERRRGATNGDRDREAANEQTDQRAGRTEEHLPRLGDPSQAGRHDTRDNAKS